MISAELKDSFLALVRSGIGHGAYSPVKSVDWNALKTLAEEHGLSAVVLDGIDRLNTNLTNGTNLADTLPLELKLEWIGEVLQDESVFAVQQKTAADMALLFHKNSIRTYVLKGQVIAECYPNPTHRSSADMDCFLVEEASSRFNVSSSKGFDAWEEGNAIIEKNGFEVKRNYYKNSTIYLPGLTVENHKFLTPFRGNKKITSLERIFQAMLHADKGENCFEGTCLYKPPVMVSALFLIEHSYSHFLHEGLTWKHVLDWMMFSRKYHEIIDWTELSVYVDEFGFRKFFDSYSRLGKCLIGEKAEDELTEKDKMMLSDIWSPLDLHETHLGLKGKLALAGNTWRARWKYKTFTELSWIHALWIQAKGVLLTKHPTLD